MSDAGGSGGSGKVARAEVLHRGAALQVELEGGEVRRIPLRRLHDRGPLIGGEGALHGDDVRIASAAVAAGWRGVDVALSNGKTLALTLDSAPLGSAVPRAEDGRPRCDLVVIGIGQLLTMDEAAPAGQRLAAQRGPEGGGGLAVGTCQGRVVWIGHGSDVTEALVFEPGGRIVDARGGLVSPGLIESHAHPVWAGDRSAEFGARSAGASYQEVAAAGGGIASTVRATRLARDKVLLAAAAVRLGRLCAFGVTTCEAKSGYALEVEGELRLLEVIAELDGLGPLELSATLLAAHAIPPEARGDDAARAEWVRVCADELPARARGLCESIDVFCDEGAFTLAEARRVLEGGKRAGLGLRVHADQLAALGASALAAEFGALSVDHLEHLPLEVIPALARSGTVAVCLPGAAINLGQPLPPARALIDGGVAVALGTDMNPGSSMTEALPLQMWLGCTALKMSVEEAWLGVTVHAARALGRPSLGRVRVGAPADLVIWDATEPEQIPYHYGANLARVVIKDGRVVATR